MCGSAAVVSVMLAAGACGGSFSPPNDRLTTAESAVRGAQEVGATNEPEAALHLKIAQEEITSAKTLMRNDENKRASHVLMRAAAEAELALNLSRAAAARADARKTMDEAAKLGAAR